MLVTAVWAVFSGIILAARIPLLKLYVDEEQAIRAGEMRLFIILATYFLCGYMDTFAYALRSIGYSLLPTVISLVGACGFRLIWVFFVFPIDYFHNIEWLAVSYPISWVMTAGCHLIFFIVLYKKLSFSPDGQEKKINPADNIAKDA